jgi:hypothetical protein
VFNNFFFYNCAIHEIMWKNTVEPGSPQTMWCMCIACWIAKARDTHSEYVILIAFPLQQWLQEDTSVLHYMYCTLPVLFPLQFLNHYIFVQTSMYYISFALIIKIYDIKFAPLINNRHVKINVHCITNTNHLFCLSGL